MLINKKNHINIKYSLLNKTLHSVRNILHKTVKKTYQVLSNDYNFFRPWKWNKIFRNHLPCPRRYWKWFSEINDSTPLIKGVGSLYFSYEIIFFCGFSFFLLKIEEYVSIIFSPAKTFLFLLSILMRETIENNKNP